MTPASEPRSAPPATLADRTPWWTATPSEAREALGTPADGLDELAVLEARARFGSNRLERPRRRAWRVLLSQFRSVLVTILLVAMAISVAVPLMEGGEQSLARFADAIVIAAILVLNAGLGFIQEFRAEGAIAELERLGPAEARVLRDGVEQRVPASDVVVGDIVVAESGDRIVGDGRLVAATFLRVDESSLTGESVPVSKRIEGVAPERPLSERASMVFAGTLVTRGSARWVVTATGVHSQTGRIASLVGATALPETPLQRRLARLGRLLGVVALLLCAAVLLVGAIRNQPLLEMSLIAVSLAVSAVPEGLPAIVTVCFAFGVRRMARSRALVRRLDSLETLGGVTVVCSDKTGTMTTNQMTVVEVLGDERERLATAMGSCNHARLPDLGDPTELALLRWALGCGVTPTAIEEEEVPFTSAEKYMKTRHLDRDGRSFRVVKGAPERVAGLCDSPPGPEALAAADALAARGLRVLAAAVDTGDGLRWVGACGMEDPPRPGVAGAVAQASAAGIRTIMITGDHGTTAAAIGERVGVVGPLVLGADIETLDDDRLRAVVGEAAVFARVSPEHKVRICDALIANGEVVAMSGDGVNDAPALKRAHVGVAMGLRGTEVAREAADIVLSDDHFATIIGAIAEGRRITDNIRRFVQFLLRANFDELLLIMTTVAIALPVPYLPIHILWINLLTDGLPALALGAEAPEPDVMRRPPRPPGEHLLSGQWRTLVFATLLGFGVVFGWYVWRLEAGDSLAAARSSTLTLAIAFELAQAMSARSQQPLWRIGIFTNRWMIAAIVTVVLMHAVLLYTPLNVVFHLEPVGAAQLGLILAIAASSLLVFEGVKALGRKAFAGPRRSVG